MHFRNAHEATVSAVSKTEDLSQPIGVRFYLYSRDRRALEVLAHELQAFGFRPTSQGSLRDFLCWLLPGRVRHGLRADAAVVLTVESLSRLEETVLALCAKNKIDWPERRMSVGRCFLPSGVSHFL